MGTAIPSESGGDHSRISQQDSLAFGRAMSLAGLSFVPQIANHESKISPRRTVG